MKKRVNFYHYWDWRTIAITASVLIGLTIIMMFFFFHDKMILAYKLARLDAETTGHIIKIEEQESMRQTIYGNIGYIDHYTVWYQYEINGIDYSQNNWIDGNKKNHWLINKIKNSPDHPIRIKFDSEEPEKSMILLD